MRILQVIDSLDPRHGGPVECVVQMTTELRGADDAVEILAVDAMGDSRGRFAYSARAARWLDAHAAEFDAVVVHGIWRHSALAVSRAARARGVPYFIYPHGALDQALPRLYPLRHVRKAVYWEIAGRSILAHAEGVCFTSINESQRATAYRGAFRSMVTGSGIRPPPARNAQQIDALLARFPALRDSSVVLFMGRLDPIKGLDVLLRAFGRMPASKHAALLIAGQGSARFETPPGANVVWAGMLTGEDKWAAFHLADLFVLPSRQESFGVAAVEALATATPVLVSDRVGIGDVIAAQGAGAIFPLDEASLAGALEEWLDRPVGAAHGNALRCYEANFLASTAAARLRAVIAAAISPRPVPATPATCQTR